MTGTSATSHADPGEPWGRASAVPSWHAEMATSGRSVESRVMSRCGLGFSLVEELRDGVSSDYTRLPHAV